METCPGKCPICDQPTLRGAISSNTAYWKVTCANKHYRLIYDVGMIEVSCGEDLCNTIRGGAAADSVIIGISRMLSRERERYLERQRLAREIEYDDAGRLFEPRS